MSLDHRLLFVTFLGCSQFWLGVSFLASGWHSFAAAVASIVWLALAGLMLVRD